MKDADGYLSFIDMFLYNNIKLKSELLRGSFNYKVFRNQHDMYKQFMEESGQVKLVNPNAVSPYDMYVWTGIDKGYRILSSYTINMNRDDRKSSIEGFRKAFNLDIHWNCTNQGWIRTDGSKKLIEATYFEGIQGLDLKYSMLLVGNDIQYRNGKIVINTDAIQNKHLRSGTEKEKKEYILNRYYILLTRPMKGTYIYIQDDALREHIIGLLPEGKVK